MIRRSVVNELTKTQMVCFSSAKDRFFPKPSKSYCMDYAIKGFQAESRKILSEMSGKGYQNYWCCGLEAMTLLFAMEACRLRECLCFLYFYTYEDLSYFQSADFYKHDVILQRRLIEAKEFLLANAVQVSYMSSDPYTSPATIRKCQTYLSEHSIGVIGCHPPAKSKTLKLLSCNGPWLVNIYDDVKTRLMW